MNFNLFVRRLHLYLALGLLPWFLMYGLSSAPFAHREWFDRFYADGIPTWKTRLEMPYELRVAPGSDLPAIGAQIMRDTGLRGSFGVNRPNSTELHVYVYTFLKSAQAKYFMDRKLLRVEDRRFRWDQFLTGMHARGGFADRDALTTSWSVVVDLVCIGFLVWVASGIYMWWQIPRTRSWGFVALGGGIALFVIFLLAL